MGRRLMCFFDGTSNRAVGPADVVPTNVYKLIQAFTYGFSGVPQITFYFSGVGTRGDTISTATGKGFDQIITEGFINLASNYMEGDSIYLFGFSRGAAAARAISGMISDPGLLHADGLEVFPELWKYFVDRNLGQGTRSILRNKLNGRLLYPRPKVEFLGAFDTVAGTSWDMAGLFSKVRMRNLHLDSCVKSAVQILSIDDNRNPSFSPLLWDRSQAHQFLEQIWMPGVHADIGGASDGTFLGDLALLTMIDRISDRCPELEWDVGYITTIGERVLEAAQVEITNERPGILRKLLWKRPREVGGEAGNHRIHPVFDLLKNQHFVIRGAKRPYQAYRPALELAKFSEARTKFLEKACSIVLDR
jgi:uncharacterized protein (DUF2235 family)